LDLQEPRDKRDPLVLRELLESLVHQELWDFTEREVPLVCPDPRVMVARLDAEETLDRLV